MQEQGSEPIARCSSIRPPRCRLGPAAATSSNELPAVLGLGLETIVQEVPFHRCMRLLREVAVRENRLPMRWCCSGIHARQRIVSTVVPAFGLVTTRHWVPFQRSMSVF